jgi:integrase/recombinase XerD
MTRLRQRMLEDMQIRNLSPHTQRAYIENVAQFARHFRRSPADLGPEEIRTYQICLLRERTLAPSSVEIAVCALRFLHKVTLKKPWSFDDLIPAPKKPRRLPVVLSPAEVVRVLDCVTSPKHRAVLTTCYAAGLRISEAVRLQPTDLDSRRMVIRIEQGKGQRALLPRYNDGGAGAVEVWIVITQCVVRKRRAVDGGD